MKKFIHVTDPENLDNIKTMGILKGRGGMGDGVYCIRLDNESATMSTESLLADYLDYRKDGIIGVVHFEHDNFIDGNILSHHEGNSLILEIVQPSQIIGIYVMSEKDFVATYLSGGSINP